MMPLMQIQELTKRFGGVVAADKLNIDVNPGEILAIIGPNGSGKSTLFNLITGIYKPNSGAVILKSENITGKTPYDVIDRGIARTFQETRVFRQIPVLQNVMAGFHRRTHTGFFDTIVRRGRTRREEKQVYEKAVELLKFTRLTDVYHRNAGNISGAEQRRLMIAIALATEPELLLLDEPTAGVSAEEAQELLGLIEQIQHKQKTILLIEHNMKVAMKVSQRMVVLNFGRQIAEGTPEEISRNEAVIEAYLGRD
jgi:branched-chain amino acid transport system ATP-binding protein